MSEILDSAEPLIFVLVGWVCGLIDGVIGVGFGVSSATILGAMGIPPLALTTSVHASRLLVFAPSALAHYKIENYKKQLIPYLLLPGILGEVLGVLRFVQLSTWTAATVSAAFLTLMGAVIVYKVREGDDGKVNGGNADFLASGLVSFFAGFLDSISGGGWAPICVSALILLGLDARVAAGTVGIIRPITTLACTAAFGVKIYMRFSWGIIAPLLVGGVSAIPLARKLAGRVPRKALRLMVGLWIFAVNLYRLVYLLQARP